MKGADTNIVLRLITEDDESQTALVRAILADEIFYVSLTVMVEVEWVLRSAYRWDRAKIADALTILTDLAGLQIEDAMSVRWAASRLRAGADFADMVHLVAMKNMAAFVTFDRKLERGAGGEAPLRIETLKTS